MNRCAPTEVEDHMTSPARVRSSSLIPLVKRSQAPLLAAPHYAQTGTSPIVTSLAHVPEALDVTLPFVSVVLGPSAIDDRTKELSFSAPRGCWSAATAYRPTQRPRSTAG